MGNFEVCPYSTGDQRGPTENCGLTNDSCELEQNFLKWSYLEDHSLGGTKVTTVERIRTCEIPKNLLT